MEFDASSAIAAFTILFICLLIWAFTTWRKLKNAENLKDWVAWSVCKSNEIRCNIPLWTHLKDAQLHTHIRDEYRIAGEEEWEYAKEIIERYQKSLMQSYFNSQLWALKGKSIYAIYGKDYFIFMLYVYLCEHDRYEKNVVFHKMQYITYMYCKSNLALQGNVPSWNESRLKEVLDDDLAKKQMTSHKIPVPGDPGVKVNYRGRP